MSLDQMYRMQFGIFILVLVLLFLILLMFYCFFFFFQAEDGIRDIGVTGVQTCALPIFWICYGEAARGAAALAATFPTDGVGDIRALLAEILVTFILVFVIISVATDERAPAGVAPLAVGVSLACGVFIAGPITGGSLNPARTLGPMIVGGQFSAVWVYIVGPIVGAMLAALLYDRFVSQADATE